MSIATLGEGLYTKLTNNPTVSSLVGTDVYPGMLPHGFTGYGITYSWVDAPNDPDNSDDQGLTRARIQIDCWADRYRWCRDLVRAVDGALNGDGGAYGSAQVQTIRRVSGPTDLPERDGDRVVHRCSLDYQLTYQE